MRFFFDNCTSKYHARGIREFADFQKHEIIHLQERFDAATPDPEWLRVLGSEDGWIVISADPAIGRSAAERAAWHESNLTAFFFAPPWQNDGYWKQCEALIRWWNPITQQARRTPKGHGFLMPKLGKEFKRIYP